MYLRRLELRGFKSFAEPTKIYFNSGINVVVGPNGCGKSNIIDAIRWVLGESNIRHLRGQRNEDVIFTGTDEKRPLGLAQVEITIDNQDKILPVDYSEVTVSRKVFRSGDSEFFINKAPVRLKDIQALFAGTGLGRKGYSIIGQGELEQVLNARAFERRLILEEAAGIIQFRQKIEEASARLQLTEQDLVRVNDILQELNQRREELAVKAEKAETWRRLQGQLDRLEQIVMASTIAVLRRELTSRSQALSSARVDDDLLRDEVRNREQELAQLTEQLDNLKNELAVSKDDKYQKGTEIGRLSGELKLAQERVRSASERLVNLAEDESKYRKMLAKLADDLRFSQDNLTQEEQRYQAMDEELGSLEQQVADIEEMIITEEEGYEHAKNRLIDKLQEEAALKNELVDVDDGIRRLRERGERCRAEAAQKQSSIVDNNESMAGLQESLTAVTREKGVRQKERAGLEDSRQCLAGDIESREKELQQLEADIISIGHQLSSYQEMAREYAGYSPGVRSVLKRARQYPSSLPGIMGVVGDIITVPSGLELALETALGRGIENVVVQGESDARRAIDFLKQNALGRVTFLPLDLLRVSKSGGAARERATRITGVVGWASELVSYPPEFEQVIRHLLGRVLVVENLEAGVNFFRGHRLASRLVTLDGEVINYSGAMTGGRSGNRSRQLLKRKNRIKELTAAEQKKSRIRDDLKVEISRLQAAMKGLENDINQNIESENKLDLRQKMLELELTRVKQDGEKLQEDIAVLEREADQCDRGIKRWEASENSLQVRLQTAAVEAEELSAQVEKLREGREEQRRQYEVLKERRNSLRKYLQSKKEELENLRQNFAQFEQVRESYLAVLEDSTRQKEGLERDLEHEKSRITDLTVLREEQQRRLQELKDEIQKQEETIVRLEEETRECRHLLKSQRRRLHKHQEQMQKIELRATRLETELENCVAQWQERFGGWKAESETILDEGQLKLMQKQIQGIRQQIEALGPVDPGAEAEYRKLKERYDFMMEQYQDIIEARDALYRLLDETREELTRQFSEFLQLADDSFNRTFIEIFGGGYARLTLDGEAPELGSGVEMMIKLPGKRRQSLDLLSGGERALTCIAFIFALLRLKPAPFCLLDEIDAALDEVNLDRFGSFLRRMSKSIQFVVVTHRQSTIEAGETIYGVTMPEEGSSRVYSLTVEEAGELAG